MSALVASYNRFPIGKYNYSFFFVSSDSPLPEKRMREVGWEIGDQFENRGIFVQPSNRLNAITTAEEVHRKEWPPLVYDRMMDEAESFVVIIDVAFEMFDPTQNSWMIVWAGRLDDVSALLGVVKWMAYLTRMQQNLFAYYGNQYAKRRYGDSITEMGKGLLVDAAEFIKNQGDYFVLETHLDSPIDFKGKKKKIKAAILLCLCICFLPEKYCLFDIIAKVNLCHLSFVTSFEDKAHKFFTPSSRDIM